MVGNWRCWNHSINLFFMECSQRCFFMSFVRVYVSCRGSFCFVLVCQVRNAVTNAFHVFSAGSLFCFFWQATGITSVAAITWCFALFFPLTDGINSGLDCPADVHSVRVLMLLIWSIFWLRPHLLKPARAFALFCSVCYEFALFSFI
jgi:hypothetical protein